MKRTIVKIPEIAGVYGMRVIVPENDLRLRYFIEAICLWGGPTDTRRITVDYCFGERGRVYELPFGIEYNSLWKRAVDSFNIEFIS